MKSSSGVYYQGLDHIRALAAFMVFSFHFVHPPAGSVDFTHVPYFPLLSMFEEGHTGVSLFMVLSGYLFSKITDGRSILIGSFFYNRAMRLLPLLLFVILIRGAERYLTGDDSLQYWTNVALGVVLPTIPGGGWSITAEFHFYLMLPLLLILAARKPIYILAVVGAFFALRVVIFAFNGSVQDAAYWTIIGRADQFILGMLFFYISRNWGRSYFLVAVAVIGLAAFYYWFNLQGGFFDFEGYPSRSAAWIVIPTIEGLGFALLVAAYDRSFTYSDAHISRAIAWVGTISYSIYLMHFFVFGRMARLVERHIMPLDDYGVAFAWSVAGFIALLPIAATTYYLIEVPFLRFRRRYIVRIPATGEHVSAVSTPVAENSGAA